MKTEREGNLLGLAVLSLLRERPRHPYEISSVMRERGLSYSIKLNFGSLYSVIEGLQEKGLIEVESRSREGNHPERTVYCATAAGEAELLERLRLLIGQPAKEYPRFVAGLAFLAHLEPRPVLALLKERSEALSLRIDAEKASYGHSRAAGVQELFLIEMDYSLCLLMAELEWIRRLSERISSGELAELGQGGGRWKALAPGQEVQGSSIEKP